MSGDGLEPLDGAAGLELLEAPASGNVDTIAQGDTRSTGLRWICTHNGTIYAARRRYRWPGVAAVVVSIVHLRQGAYG